MQSAEASFSIHKKEELYRRHYTSEADLIRGIHQFIDFYNKVLCASNRLFNTKTAKKKPHRKAQNWLNHAVFHWPARRDSNPRPLESESTAISSFATGGYLLTSYILHCPRGFCKNFFCFCLHSRRNMLQ